jgi:hypothetical protein
MAMQTVKKTVVETNRDTGERIVEDRPETVVVPDEQVRTTKGGYVMATPGVAAYQQKKVIFRSYQVIWYVLGIAEVLLAFRFVLRFLGANPNSGFASLIYGLSYPLILPFMGLFGPSLAVARSVIEWSTPVAMIVYAILAYAIVQLLQLVKPVDSDEVDSVVDGQ